MTEFRDVDENKEEIEQEITEEDLMVTTTY
jgi:hypothetical protein